MVTGHAIPLSALFFKEGIRLVSPISMETRERPTPNSDLDWPKENAQTIDVIDFCDHLQFIAISLDF